MLAAVIVYWAVLRPISIRRAYARNPALHREITADFNATGMCATDETGNGSEFVWNHFDRFLESSRVFVLGTPGNIFYIVSKSGMNHSEQQELRALLGGTIPKR